MSVVLDPGTETGGNLEDWKRGVEESTYQKTQLLPAVEDYGGRIYGLAHVRKTQRVTGTVLAQTAHGTSLTYLNILGTPITITPVGNVVPIAWSENYDAQVDFDFRSFRNELEMSMAELLETNVAANFASLTQFISQAGADAAGFRQAVARLRGNTNGMAAPGGSEEILGFFSHTQEPNLMAIPEVNNAEQRGDSENPYVKGTWVKGFGVRLMISTVVYQDGNGWHNAVFLKKCLIAGWNRRTTIKEQEEELQNRLILYSNMGSSVLHDLRGLAFRTTASAL